MLAFTDALGLKSSALCVFDYGAPTGFRLDMARPELVTAIVSQNGNAYVEGLGDARAPQQTVLDASHLRKSEGDSQGLKRRRSSRRKPL